MSEQLRALIEHLQIQHEVEGGIEGLPGGHETWASETGRLLSELRQTFPNTSDGDMEFLQEAAQHFIPMYHGVLQERFFTPGEGLSQEELEAHYEEQARIFSERLIDDYRSIFLSIEEDEAPDGPRVEAGAAPARAAQQVQDSAADMMAFLHGVSDRSGGFLREVFNWAGGAGNGPTPEILQTPEGEAIAEYLDDAMSALNRDGHDREGGQFRIYDETGNAVTSLVNEDTPGYNSERGGLQMGGASPSEMAEHLEEQIAQDILDGDFRPEMDLGFDFEGVDPQGESPRDIEAQAIARRFAHDYVDQLRDAGFFTNGAYVITASDGTQTAYFDPSDNERALAAEILFERPEYVAANPEAAAPTLAAETHDPELFEEIIAAQENANYSDDDQMVDSLRTRFRDMAENGEIQVQGRDDPSVALDALDVVIADVAEAMRAGDHHRSYIEQGWDDEQFDRLMREALAEEGLQIFTPGYEGFEPLHSPADPEPNEPKGSDPVPNNNNVVGGMTP